MSGLLKQYSHSGLVKPLKGKRLKRELHAAEKLEFSPMQRQLKSEKRASKMQQGRIKDWFGQYQDALAQIQSQTPNFYSAAQGQVAATENATSAYSEQLRQRLAAESGQNAQTYGQTVNPQTSQTAVAADLSRRNVGDSYANMLATQGASQSSYLADKSRIGAGEEVDQLLKEQARRRSVDADQRNLASQKKAFAEDFINKNREGERNTYLGLLQAHLGAKSSKRSARVSAQNSKRSARVSAANSRRSAASSAASRRQQRHQFNLTHTKGGKSKGTKGSGGSSGGGSDHIQHQDVRAALAILRANRKHLPGSRQKIIDKLIRSDQTINRQEAAKAYKRYRKQNAPTWRDHGPKGHR